MHWPKCHRQVSGHVTQSQWKAASQKSKPPHFGLCGPPGLRQEAHFGLEPGLEGEKILGRKFQLFKALGSWEGQSERSSSGNAWLSSLSWLFLFSALSESPGPWGVVSPCFALPHCHHGLSQHFWGRHHPPPSLSTFLTPKFLGCAAPQSAPSPCISRAETLWAYDPQSDGKCTTHQAMASSKWHWVVRFLSNWTEQIWR